MSTSSPGASNPYDLFAPAAVADPYPVYDRLRAEAPIYWNDRFYAWMLTRYADVKALLSDPRIGASRLDNRVPPDLADDLQASWAEISRFGSLWITSMDPPDHRRLRRLLNAGFKPRLIENLRPRIQVIADELLDAVQERGELEAITDFAYPLPAMVIGELLGMPAQDRPLLRVWSQRMIKFLLIVNRGQRESIENMHQTITEMRDYLGALIAERRRVPREDLLSGLIAAEEQGEMLGEEELIASCAVLLFAGHETTMNLIGNGLLALLRHPEQYQQLVDDPALAPNAVEELLRYDGPAPFAWRFTLADVAINGQEISAGQRVVLCLGAANHDPAQFPDPGRLDIRRSNAGTSLAFGQGIHFCLGAPLARLEAQIAFATLPRRLPGLRLLSETATWRPEINLRALTELPLRFDPGSRASAGSLPAHY